MNIYSIPCSVLFLVMTTLLSGCIKLDLTLTLSRTGQVTAGVNYSVSKQTIINMNAMRKLKEKLASLTGTASEVEPSDEFLNMLLNMSEADIKKEFSNYSKYGVNLNYLSVENQADQRYVRCEFTVTNIAKLSDIPLLADCDLSLLRGSDGNYTLSHPELAKLNNAVLEVFDMKPGDSRVPLLDRFRVSIRVNTPSAILRTNAHRKTQSSAIWVFDSESDPAAFFALHRQPFLVQFSGANLQLPEIKPVQKNARTTDK